MDINGLSIAISTILSLVITFTGLYLTHRLEVKKLAVESKKIDEEAKINKIKVDAEADKLEAEKEKIVLESGVAQLDYFSAALANMRKELDFQSSRGRDNADKIAIFEAKLLESDREKAVLAKENNALKMQVEEQEKKIKSQETEIMELRGKIEILERKNDKQ
jgi:hypothetical protein